MNDSAAVPQCTAVHGWWIVLVTGAVSVLLQLLVIAWFWAGTLPGDARIGHAGSQAHDGLQVRTPMESRR